MQVFCIVGIFITHGANNLGYFGPESGWSQYFDIGTKGEQQGDKLFVDLHIDGNSGVAIILA